MNISPSSMTLGAIIDRMETLKRQRGELSAQDKELKTEYDELELALLTKLNENGITQSRGSLATATVSQITVPTIEDWGAFEEYVMQKEALYMLEKRVSSAAFRELIQQGEEVPGLKPFVKTSISLRKLS